MKTIKKVDINTPPAILLDQLAIRDELLKDAHAWLGEVGVYNTDERMKKSFRRLDKRLQAAGFFPLRAEIDAQGKPIEAK